MKRLFINEIENMRDLGGYITREGLTIPYNRFIRSNLPVSLNKENIEVLLKNNIKTVIDLRSDEEVQKKNSIFFNNIYFNYYHIKINGNGRIPNKPEDVLASYVEMIEGKEEIRKIFSILAKNTAGVIYYCNAGKDRTGVISALILKLLGVNDKDIIDDYVVSGVFLHKMLNEFASNSSIKNIKEIITPRADIIIRLLDYIDDTYCGVEKYLESCGITEPEIKNIKACSKV